ncbi:MAG: D-galactarate dehydratase [Betaproteobacteria bacterium RIFCSPLOWO2_12_FULL_65_14]|nr:MAG: D-galactarate dehydratase [Betaproteobacteria bacterium RIFCSPLOWO2_12_FULL_65_14]
MPRAIVLHPSDNVATLIDAANAGEACTLQGESSGELRALTAIPFGHKICIRGISAGANVVKYGQVIGKASARIEVGAHVHAHNVESNRARGDRAKE